MKTIPLKRVAVVIAGQSPESAAVSDFEGAGLPFLQGNAEFGTDFPTPKNRCDAAAKVAKLGDILLSVRAPVGALNRADRDYAIGRGLCAIRPTSSDGRFLWWALCSRIDALQSVATGSTYTAVTADDVAAISVPEFKLAEQRAIADYLDVETARIDALIARKQQLIHLLEERLLSAISAPRVGVERFRLKHLLSMRPSYGVLVPRFVESGNGVKFVRVNALGRLDHKVDLPEIDPAQHVEYRRTTLTGGEVLVSVVGTMGRACVVPDQFRGANIARAVCRLVPRFAADAELLRVWITHSDSYRDQAALAVGGGTAQPTLNVGDLVDFVISVPSDSRVRDSYTNDLLQIERQNSVASSEITRQISLLAERRQALITAAVTGEFAVPGAP